VVGLLLDLETGDFMSILQSDNYYEIQKWIHKIESRRGLKRTLEHLIKDIKVAKDRLKSFSKKYKTK